jgi:hypothetical protein
MIDDLKTIEAFLAKIEANGGQLVIGKAGLIWNVAMLTRTEEDEMTVSGFSTGPDISEVLDDVADELDMF